MILDIIDSKTSALLTYISIALAIFLFTFGMIADGKAFDLSGAGKSIISVIILFATIFSIFAIILCLSCLNIVGAHTVFDLNKDEYLDYVVAVTLGRRNRYRRAQQISMGTSFGLLAVFLILSVEYTTVFADPEFDIPNAFKYLVLFMTSGLLLSLPLLTAFGVRIIRPMQKRVLPGWYIGNVAAFVAGISWGIGNYITKYSADKLGQTNYTSLIEIGFWNFLGGFLFLFIFRRLWQRFDMPEENRETLTLKSMLSDGRIRLALCKAANTIFFVLAIAYIPAADAALLENTHVVWITIAAVILGWVRVHLSVLVSGFLIFLAVLLALGHSSATWISPLGVLFGILSGITYAVFLFYFDRSNSEANKDTYSETMNMALLVAVLLFLSGPVIATWSSGMSSLFQLSIVDITIQIANGTFNVGLTYLLISYASKSMKDIGSLSLIVISIALCYSVFITLGTESLLTHTAIGLPQALGLIVFSIGFIVLRYSTRDLHPKK